MKNQYFGDKKDVFKFGVCLKLLKDLKISKFTWIAMRTLDEEEEPYKDFGWVDLELRRFFNRLRQPQNLSITLIEGFFKEHYDTVERFIYYRTFTSDYRKDYFESINEEKLRDTLILVDPDTGLEVKTMNRKPDQYLKFDELKCLFNKMNKNSILSVFQHKRREKFEELLEKLKEDINKKLLNPKPKLLAVWSNKAQVMMILLFKDAELYKDAQKCLKAVSSDDVKMEIV